MSVFVLLQKVGFAHCDPAGMVFYPRYFEMFNLTVEEWFADRLQIPFNILHGPMNAGIPTVSLTTEFKAASYLGDILEFSLKPTRLGKSSMDLSVEAWCGDEHRLTINSTIVFMSLGDRKSMPWTEEVIKNVTSELSGST